MRGDIVIVRTFGGKPVERRVWGIGDSVIYVTNEDEFAKLEAGKPALGPVGFPKEDVFCPPAEESDLGRVDWSSLVQWKNERWPHE